MVNTWEHHPPCQRPAMGPCPWAHHLCWGKRKKKEKKKSRASPTLPMPRNGTLQWVPGKTGKKNRKKKKKQNEHQPPCQCPSRENKKREAYCRVRGLGENTFYNERTHSTMREHILRNKNRDVYFRVHGLGGNTFYNERTHSTEQTQGRLLSVHGLGV